VASTRDIIEECRRSVAEVRLEHEEVAARLQMRGGECV